jgi:hypothetical protein
MAITPAFTSAPIGKPKLLTTLDAAYTAPVTAVVDLLSGSTEVPAAGTRISSIEVQGAQAAIAACVVRIWIHDGTSYFLKKEIAVTAVTGSTTAVTASNLATFADFILPFGYKLAATISVTQNMVVVVNGGTLT